MRATITVDGELAEKLERLSRERATSFEALADEALRGGLEHLTAAPPRTTATRVSYTHPVSLGSCLLGNLHDVAGALAAAEGESFK